MNARKMTWFSFSHTASTNLTCAVCGQEIELGPDADHHPRDCPKCGVESAFLAWKDRNVQIVPSHAPSAVVAILRLAQRHFDELDYVEFVCALEEIADAMSESPIQASD